MKTAELLTITDKLGIPLGKVNTIQEFFEDLQAKDSKAYVEFRDPELGLVRHLNFPVEFERCQVHTDRRAPRLGEHTESVLGNAGISED